MTTETIDQALIDKVLGMGEKSIDRLIEAGNINADILKKVASHQVDVAYAFVELGAKQLQVVSEAKDPAELYRVENELADELKEKLTAYSDALRGVADEAREAYVSLARETMSGEAKTA